MSARQVVVVGGGIAGLSAAFELTDPQHCRMRKRGCRCRDGNRHEHCSTPRKVFVYEKRCELGGKGASVRNEALGGRIEEHGLHIWFGYYENSFRLLDRCHKALDEFEREGVPRWSTLLGQVSDGFRRASRVGLADDDDFIGNWTRWWTEFPEDNTLPWDREDLDEPVEFDLRWFLPEVGRRTTQLLHAALRSLTTDNELADMARLVEAVDTMLEDLDPVLHRLFSAALRWSTYLRRQSAQVPRPALVSLALSSLEAIDQLLDYIRRSHDVNIALNPTARRLITILDLMLGSTRGLLVGGISSDADIDRLDEWEWSDWLAANGVLGVSRDSSLVRALSYCLPFAYQGGSRDMPSFSAAVGIRLFLRTFFTYRGALMWKMNYGMGEVAFAPLYEVLRKRNVSFHFEYELTKVEVKNARVKALHFLRPAPPHPAPASADPWPMRVLRLRDETLCYWPLREPSKRPKEPHSVVTEQCEVVLAMPLCAIRAADGEFVNATARWREAVHGRARHDGQEAQGLESVATQSVQLWLTEPAESALGWPEDITVSGFSEPFDTFSDMTPLLGAEPAPTDGTRPRGLVYLCSVRRDPSEARRRPEQTIEDDLALFLGERAVYLWPAARRGNGALPTDLVIGVAENETLKRIRDAIAGNRGQRAPFLRVNDAPSDRYNLSLPGTATLRIEPGNTGYENLFAAGDWTACILNAGCIEAATISGMLAAEAVLEENLQIIGRGR